MIVLGIESSCDETAAALVRDGHEILAGKIATQIKLHSGYGGVIPELAAREHLKNITPVVDYVFQQAGLSPDEIDAVAVTNRPGLIPALLVGNAWAKGLALSRNLPIIGINHFEGHIYGAFVKHPELLENSHAFPVIALVVSGGHTAIVRIEASGKATLMGTTLDDAAGEALDKAAKILGLGYPGGPVIDRLAKLGNDRAYDFPRGLTGGSGKGTAPEHRFDFSFSGVKTALLYAVKGRELNDQELADVVASYQRAVMEVLVSKAILAAKESKARTICLCGGVACNSLLRQRIQEEATKNKLSFLLAEPACCTDNAVMIAGLAWHYLRHGHKDALDMPVSARLPDALAPFPFAPEYQPDLANS